MALRVIAAGFEVAFVLDRAGVVQDVSFGEGMAPHPGWAKLAGRPWAETVTIESKPKVEQLVRDAAAGKPTQAREVNQLVDGLGEVALRVSTLGLDVTSDGIVVLGRDLRPMAALQQRMVAAQQATDREFARLRQADRRYRVLFHVSSEGVLVADAQTKRILEANPAAASILGETAAALQGRTPADLVDAVSREPLRGLLVAAEAGARTSEIEVGLEGHGERRVTVTASLFRQENATLLLVRLAPPTGATSGTRASRMLGALEAMPDAFVVTSDEGTVLCGNPAFCELVQQASEVQVVGQSLERWFGRPGVDLKILFANLREHGSVRGFSTIVRGEFGPPVEATVTAVSALDGRVPSFGICIRAASSRTSSSAGRPMARSAEQLRELVGRVPLKDLVRESADLIEKLCIEAALDVSGNNRASAAQILGLSRQGLYSKLRRYGIAAFEES